MNEAIWLRNAAALEECLGFAHKESPLVFLVIKFLLKHVHSQQSDIDDLHVCPRLEIPLQSL